MPNKCCVPRCRGNYTAESKSHVFRFPRNEDLLMKWIRAIPRQDFCPTRNSRVCEAHFSPEDILKETSYVDDASGQTVTAPLPCPRLRPNAVPSRFPACPTYMSTENVIRDSPDTKRIRLDASAMQRALAESAETFRLEEEADKIVRIDDIVAYIRLKKSTFWHTIQSNERIILLHIVEDEAPRIKYSVTIKADLVVSFHFMKRLATKLGPNLHVPPTAKSKRELEEFLDGVQKWDSNLDSTSQKPQEIFNAISFLLDELRDTTEEGVRSLQFISEQLKLLPMNKVRRRYSAEFMVFCCLLFTISPHAYKYVRSYGNVILPHPMTIRSICSSYGMNPQLEHENSAFLKYMATRISDLDDYQRTATLMVDEIHIKAFFDYKGGGVTGVAHNSTEAANSALVFMVQSLTCKFKEVAHIVPVRGADANFLHRLLKDVICGLEKIGYKIICVVTDNNKVNGKAMEKFKNSAPCLGDNQPSFLYPHPCSSERPLFFIIDTVHLLKCIRNNWLRQLNDQHCFSFPNFHEGMAQERRMLSASFDTLRDVYDIELSKLLRHAYTLSRKGLFPSDLEKQNVKLALQVFNDTLPPALRVIAAKHTLSHVEGTASFIEIIVKWWKIVNVKTPCKGTKLKDQFQEPVFSMDDPKIIFLYNFLDWLDEWKENTKDSDSGKLTKETHGALHQTTYGLIELARYCLDELNLSYVLLGKIQTDGLEHRFGKYRQLAGAQYHVSIRQVYECENKLRLQNILPLVGTKPRGCVDEDQQWDNLEKEGERSRPNCNVVVSQQTLTKIKGIIPVLVYVAGYAVYAALKKLKCESCRAALTVSKEITVSVEEEHYDLIRQMDRGGLVHPAMFVVNAVAHNYAVVEQLAKQREFLSMPCQRKVVTELTVELLMKEESQDFDACDNGHTSELVLKHVLWCSTNILLKNFCCRMNDSIADASSKSKQRKLKTVSSK